MKKLVALVAAGIIGLGSVSVAHSQGLFKANEANLLLFGTWVDDQKDQWGGGLGFNYFLTQDLGLGVSTHMENVDGSFIDNVSGEIIFRLPLGKLPLAPYGIGSGGYSWDHEKWFAGGGGGLEFRFTKTFGLFGDAQYLFYDGGRIDGWGARVGLRLGM